VLLKKALADSIDKINKSEVFKNFKPFVEKVREILQQN